ncbi:MAG: hypothetical protein A2293_00200 [Elusimicrobia bacterium RIFOXYB2_FULL_49_7]|nr:MAG: hypothetical protein A2293_00200 [Elusimicrobia bacterium RIFOXYB2_FULL_49_7]
MRGWRVGLRWAWIGGGSVFFLTACLATQSPKQKGGENVSGAVMDSASKTASTAARDSASIHTRKHDSVRLSQTELNRLSEATKLLLQTIDNYVEVLPSGAKTPEIVMLKGHTFYNNKLFERARESYKTVLDRYSKSLEVPEAIKMTAQTYYEENKYDEAQNWYKKLEDVAVSGQDKEEAAVRIAESHFRLGERLREAGKIELAISEFEKVVVEYPNAKIADAALFNVGLLYEEKKEWSKAILTYNKLIANYPNSSALENGFLKTARCYEQMGNWMKAAQTYVEIFQRFPQSKNMKEALFNAGLCYEKGENLVLSAKAFEKYATLFPDEKDAPDVLFRAGEIYGKLQDWANVEKINTLFGKRYGQDKNRIVMALCMTGVASYMQQKTDKALDEFAKAIEVGGKIGVDNKTNAFYMAKAQFTIGQINQELSERIDLVLPESEYKARLNRRIKYMENATTAYAAVSEYRLLEWTTHAIYKIGETYEQFGVAVYKRERPKNMDYGKVAAFEQGIAEVLEQYFSDKALLAHEQNVKIGIQYKYEDEWTARSRQQLAKLPFMAGAAYSRLLTALDVQAAVPQKAGGNPLLLIQQKLERLQTLAPFQDRAIKLYLKTLEMSVRYAVEDKYRFSASAAITQMSYQVGTTYAEVVSIARGAPIPSAYDAYKKFFYKVHLLGEGLVEYENNALEALYKNIKIAEAYDIKDEWIQKSKEKIAEILFQRSFCYEVLAEEALREPPVPTGATDEEREEYSAQFEELGFKLQEESQGIYRDIVEKGKNGITRGEYLDLAYLRLFSMLPDEVGERVERDTARLVASGKEWRFRLSQDTLWEQPSYDDSGWEPVKKGIKPDSIALLGATVPMLPVWGGRMENNTFSHARQVWLRGEFMVRSGAEKAVMEFAATGHYDIYLNGRLLRSDSLERSDSWFRCRKKEGLDSLLSKGRNVIAVHVNGQTGGAYGFYMNLFFNDRIVETLPHLPSRETPLSQDEFKSLKPVFPVMPNFEYKPEMFK